MSLYAQPPYPSVGQAFHSIHREKENLVAERDFILRQSVEEVVEMVE